VYLQTEIDDSNSGITRSDNKSVDDRFHEVENQLPVVDTATLVMTDTSGVVKQEHNVSDTVCTE